MTKRFPEGTVFRRKDGKWVASVSLGTLGGKRVRRVVYGNSKTEATRELDRLRKALENTASAEATQLSMAEFLFRWLETVKTNHRYSTYRSAENKVRLHIIPYIGTFKVSNVTPLLVQGFVGSLEKDGKTQSTRREAYRILSWALDHAVAWQLLYRNPCTGIKVSLPHREMKCWNEREVRRFLRTAKGDRFFALYVLALSTGMRLGELLALKWCAVQWEPPAIKVERTLSDVHGRLAVIEDVKSKSSRRTVPIPAYAVDALRAHKKLMEAKGYRGEFLFVGERKHRLLSRAFINQKFHRMRMKARVRHVRFHDLRHTSATILMAEGIHPRIVADRLGHAQPSTTLDIYSHAVPTLQKEAAKKIDRFLKEIGLTMPV